MHRRLRPVLHEFCHRIFMVYLTLDDTREARSSWLFGWNRFALFSFHDRDHLGSGNRSARMALEEYLCQHGIELSPEDPVRLLTFPRVLGYVFNPVSFYFCERSDGTLKCCVAEVGNTFGEKKRYLIPADSSGHCKLRETKHFYVSPFSELDLEFDFRLRWPGEELEVEIDDYREEELVLQSRLAGQRQTYTRARLTWFAIKYPLVTLKVILLIHWHALLLWWKKAPWFRKAAHPELQQHVLQPHPSLSGKTK